ncbi:MAG: hypothetical protein ACLFPQ_00680 [Candidatus Woesearchaeota archaeon]
MVLNDKVIGYERAITVAKDFLGDRYDSLERREKRKIEKLSRSYGKRFSDPRYENTRTQYHKDTVNHFQKDLIKIFNGPEISDIEFSLERNESWLNIVRESNEGIKEFVRGLYEEANEQALRYMPYGSERRKRFQDIMSERIRNVDALLDSDLETLEERIRKVNESKDRRKSAEELNERYFRALQSKRKSKKR